MLGRDEDEFKPDAKYIRMMRFAYGNANKQVKRNFDKMTFEQLVDNYMLATRAINELVYVEGGEFMLEVRCDTIAVKTRDVLKDLKQYKIEIINYFDSLKKLATENNSQKD